MNVHQKACVLPINDDRTVGRCGLMGEEEDEGEEEQHHNNAVYCFKHEQAYDNRDTTSTLGCAVRTKGAVDHNETADDTYPCCTDFHRWRQMLVRRRKKN